MKCTGPAKTQAPSSQQPGKTVHPQRPHRIPPPAIRAPSLQSLYGRPQRHARLKPPYYARPAATLCSAHSPIGTRTAQERHQERKSGHFKRRRGSNKARPSQHAENKRRRRKRSRRALNAKDKEEGTTTEAASWWLVCALKTLSKRVESIPSTL